MQRISLTALKIGHSAKFISMARGLLGNHAAATREKFLLVADTSVARHDACQTFFVCKFVCRLIGLGRSDWFCYIPENGCVLSPSVEVFRKGSAEGGGRSETGGFLLFFSLVFLWDYL